MSKFFGAVGDESSSEESSSEGESEELEEVKEEAKQKFTRTDKALISDSSDEEEERKILTPEHKMREALRKITKPLNDHVRDKDYASMHTSFNELVKAIQKNSDVMRGAGTPNFLLKTLMRMEDLLTSIRPADEKNMTRNNKKNFGTLHNKFKKFIKAEFEKELGEYRKDPKDSEVEEDEDEDEDENEEEEVKPKPSKK